MLFLGLFKRLNRRVWQDGFQAGYREGAEAERAAAERSREHARRMTDPEYAARVERRLACRRIWLGQGFSIETIRAYEEHLAAHGQLEAERDRMLVARGA